MWKYTNFSGEGVSGFYRNVCIFLGTYMTSHPRRQWYLKCNTFYLLYHYRKECKFCWIKSYTILPFSGLAHVSVLVDKTDGLPYCKGYLPRLNSRSNLKQPLPVSLSTCRVPVYWPSARRNLSLYEDTSTLSPFSEHILNCKEHIKQCKKFNPVSNGFYLAWNTYKNIYIFLNPSSFNISPYIYYRFVWCFY